LSRYIHLNPVCLRRHGLEKKSRAAERVGLGRQATPEVISERLRALKGHPANTKVTSEEEVFAFVGLPCAHPWERQ